MTELDMVDAVMAMVDDERFKEAVITVYLPMAKDAVVSRLFPYDCEATWDDVPERHHMQTCQIAVYLLDKSGAEGEVRHVENGTTHEWKSAGIPADYFAGMVPLAGVPL